MFNARKQLQAIKAEFHGIRCQIRQHSRGDVHDYAVKSAPRLNFATKKKDETNKMLDIAAIHIIDGVKHSRLIVSCAWTHFHYTVGIR